jgi:hypothetical protein
MSRHYLRTNPEGRRGPLWMIIRDPLERAEEFLEGSIWKTERNFISNGDSLALREKLSIIRRLLDKPPMLSAHASASPGSCLTGTS